MKEKLQTLLDNFYEVCVYCDELNIYEFPDWDSSMGEMKEWTNENFGRRMERLKD